MSDNEFDDDVDLDEAFEDFSETGPAKGGSDWKKTPAFKIGVVVAAGVLIVGVVTMMGGEKEPEALQSQVAGGSNVASTPGTQEASPAYIEALEEQNEADIERAEATGGSSLPVPIEPQIGQISLPEQQEDEEDPLQRWRRLQEERLQREIKQRETISAASISSNKDRQKVIENLSKLMSSQMSSILGENSRSTVSQLSVTDLSFLDTLRNPPEAVDANGVALDGSSDGGDALLSEEAIADVLLPAGEVLYAQMLTEANSDVPGPILAQILNGPLAGRRVIGDFEVADEYLVLNFHTVIVEDQSVAIQGVAVDPDTTLTAVATDVDHHYLQRIFLPAAAAFIEGLTSAIAESGSTTITINSTSTTAEEDEDQDTDQEIATGVSEAGAEIRQIVDDINSDLETTIIVRSGTPIGILFVEPVYESDEIL